MDDTDETMLAMWRSQADLADEVLAENATNPTARRFLPAEIEEIKAEKARFLGLIAAHKAALDA